MFVRICFTLLSMFIAATAVEATTTRWHYETAYDNWEDGTWLRNENNEEAELAWGESYVMESLAAMYRVTGDPVYLDRLAWHIEGVLAQRDDARGVTDYRGDSGACWRCTIYTTEPYCWSAHSGMIGFPVAEFGALVREAGFEEHHASDGETYGAKADRYVAAVIETLEFHEEQWNDAGYYVFREDADFTGYAGLDVPYNMNAAMGRMILALYRATGDEAWRNRAQAMGSYFASGLSVGPSGQYLWNYWGGTYVQPGEDLSHAFINVSFAAELAQQGLVFTAEDMWAFSETLVSGVYIDDYTHARFIGGGEVNYESDPWFTALWSPLTPWRTTVYTVGRNLFEREVDPDTISSGWLLLGWALLAEHQPPHCAHFFYSVDWDDQGDWQQATAYSSNILTVPPDLDQGCIVPLRYQAQQPLTVGQWDGSDYYPVARWQGRSEESSRFIAYEPAWPFVYWDLGVLFQFADDFVSGQGIRVHEPEILTPPTITSEPPAFCTPGEPVTLVPSASGDGPLWWSLEAPPLDARVDAATGTLSWTPGESCNATFLLRVENDVGSDTQTWTFDDPGTLTDLDDTGDSVAMADTHGSEDMGADIPADTGLNPDTATDTHVSTDPGILADTGIVTDSASPEETGAPEQSGPGAEGDSTDSGCGCSVSPVMGSLWMFGIAALGLRRSRNTSK